MLTAQFLIDLIEQVLLETERVSERERDLPAHVMMYYVIALALYAEVSTREVLRLAELRQGTVVGIPANQVFAGALTRQIP